MGAARPKITFALDTNVLFDLAATHDFAHTFREIYQEQGVTLAVPPTVIQELTLLHKTSTEPKGSLAYKALSLMRSWKLAPYVLTPVQHGYAEGFSKRLIEKKLLPEDEANDGEILAEASLYEANGLVTADGHLLKIPEAELLTVFNERGLKPVKVYHPKVLLKAAQRAGHK